MEKKMDLRNLKLKESLEKNLPFNLIEKVYKKLCKQLNTKHQGEPARTLKEFQVYKILKKKTKVKILRSIWIKKRNIDLFIPCLRGERVLQQLNSFKGLVIEVDGDIHNEYGKMKRDNSKYEQLDKLKIALYTIENKDLNEKTFQDLANSFNRLKRLDSRGRKRVLRNVYLATLYAHRSDFDLNKYFNGEQVSLITKIGKLL